MNFAGIWNTSQEDYHILFNNWILSDSSYFLSTMAGVKILIIHSGTHDSIMQYFECVCKFCNKVYFYVSIYYDLWLGRTED